MSSGELRLFVSSTFRDLMPEREELIKKVFPQVRALCRERGVEFTEIDLRWGITAEEARTGKVVRICLEEIDKCSPYFIGIIGSRYGWSPDEEVLHNDPLLAEDYQWLPSLIAQKKSITAIEFSHGAILKKNTDSAFIYDQIHKGEIDSQNRTALEGVNQDVIQAGVPLRSFASPQELGELVLRDLTTLIDRDFPVASEPTLLELERAPHDAFAINRRRSYVANPDYLARFNDHIESDGLPLVIWGRSGLGKSALMAYLSDKTHAKDQFIITHFVGAAPTGSDPEDVMRQVMMEIKERYGLSDEIPTQESKILEDFPLWLAKVTDEKLVLIIDAVNQLTGLAEEMHWLPEFIPPNIRLVISTTPGISLDNLRKRKWNELELQPLDESMRRRIAEEYLRAFHKTLTPEQAERIATDPKCQSPLFLRTLLEELRVFGVFEEFESHLDNYLASENERDLFHKVLIRMEYDHGAETVRDVMRAIWASRFGLSESELLNITNIPRAHLSVFLTGLEYHLMKRSGLYTFFHNHLREGVEARYLTSDESKKQAHRHLANYFSQDEYTIRRRDEEPYQWKKVEDVTRLVDSVTTMEILHLFIRDVKEYELLGYWIGLDHKEMVPAYAKMFEDVEAHERPEIIARTAYEIGHFLQRASKPNDALLFLQKALTLSEELYGKESDSLGDILDELTTTYTDLSQFDEGIRATEHKLHTLNESSSGYSFKRCECLVSLSTLAYHKGDLELAKSYCMEVLDLTKSGSYEAQNQRAQSLGNLTAVYTAQSDLVSALRSNKESIEIHTRIHGENHIETIRMQQNLAIVYTLAKQYTDAEKLYTAIEGILVSVLGAINLFLALVYEAHASLCYRMSKTLEGKELQDKVINIREILLNSNDPNLLLAYLSKAAYLSKKEDTEKARKIYEEKLPILRKMLGDEHPTIKVYSQRYNELLRYSNGTILN